MGLRCSVLGHDYGDSFVERDREERGNEVVVTERELQECARCGAEKVTSENTEVRSIEPADRSAGSRRQSNAGGTRSTQSQGASSGESSRASGRTRSGAAADASAGSARSANASAGDGPSASGGESTGGSGKSDAFTSTSDAIEQAESGTAAEESDVDSDADDAVILDDGPDDAGTGSGQWDEPADPDVDPERAEPEPPVDAEDEDVEFVDTGTSERDADDPTDQEATTDRQPAPDQEPPAESETEPAARSPEPGSPAEQSTDARQSDPARADQSPAGAEAAGAEAAGGAASQQTSDTDRPRGDWPDPEGDDEGFDAGTAPGDATAEVQVADEPDRLVEGDTGFTSAGPVEQSDTDTLDFALYCPECGFERYAAGSSLRAGDICPECKRGYIAEDR